MWQVAMMNAKIEIPQFPELEFEEPLPNPLPPLLNPPPSLEFDREGALLFGILCLGAELYRGLVFG